jgi:hypothetical protein
MRRLLALLLLAAAPAQAEAWRASYLITVAGAPVMEAEVAFDLGGAGYRVETRTRPRGVGSLLLRGESVSLSEGRWQGAEARPAYHEARSHWRSGPRRTRLDYGPDGEPRLAVLEPAEDIPRAPLPPGPRAGTLDNLSALAQLARHVRDTGRCDTGATAFDGRRLTRFEVTRDPVMQAADGGLLDREPPAGRLRAGPSRFGQPHRDPRPVRGAAPRRAGAAGAGGDRRALVGPHRGAARLRHARVTGAARPPSTAPSRPGSSAGAAATRSAPSPEP